MLNKYNIMLYIYGPNNIFQRLEILTSYYTYAMSLNEELTFIWTITKECPFTFLYYFKPITNVHVISELPKNINIDFSITNPHECGCDYTILKLNSHVKVKLNKLLKLHKNKFNAIYINHEINTSMNLQTQYEEFLDQYDMDIYIGSTSQESYTTFLDLYYNFVKIKSYDNNPLINLYMCALSQHFKGAKNEKIHNSIVHLRKIIQTYKRLKPTISSLIFL